MDIYFVDRFSHVYDFGRTIGEGRYGIVAEAYKDDEKVACKIVDRENDYLRELNHLIECKGCLGVLPLQKVFFCSDRMLMQFPLAQSMNCFKKFKTLYDRLEYCLRTCIYLLMAVRDIHERGIVHRDIKPENIVEWNRKPHLIDFGMSKRLIDLEEIPSNYSITTCTYRAPELYSLLEDEFYGPLVDEWSIGCILTECFTGISPFEAKDEDEIREKISRFISWRTGRSNSKRPLNLFRKIYDSFQSFKTRETNRLGTVRLESECHTMFNAVLFLITGLLQPYVENRYSASRILKILHIPRPQTIAPVQEKIKESIKIDEATYQATLIEIFSASSIVKDYSPIVFYHTIFLWRHCLSRGICNEDYLKLYLACSCLSSSYHGLHDNEQSEFLSIFDYRHEFIDRLSLDVLKQLNGRVWIQMDIDIENDRWNSTREKKNLKKIHMTK